jgi:hypothetical protein
MSKTYNYKNTFKSKTTYQTKLLLHNIDCLQHVQIKLVEVSLVDMDFILNFPSTLDIARIILCKILAIYKFFHLIINSKWGVNLLCVFIFHVLNINGSQIHTTLIIHMLISLGCGVI